MYREPVEYFFDPEAIIPGLYIRKTVTGGGHATIHFGSPLDRRPFYVRAIREKFKKWANETLTGKYHIDDHSSLIMVCNNDSSIIYSIFSNRVFVKSISIEKLMDCWIVMFETIIRGQGICRPNIKWGMHDIPFWCPQSYTTLRMKRWLQENCAGNFQFNENGDAISFTDETDAMMAYLKFK